MRVELEFHHGDTVPLKSGYQSLRSRQQLWHHGFTFTQTATAPRQRHFMQSQMLKGIGYLAALGDQFYTYTCSGEKFL